MSILEPFVQPIESKCVYDRVLGLADQQFVKSNMVTAHGILQRLLGRYGKIDIANSKVRPMD